MKGLANYIVGKNYFSNLKGHHQKRSRKLASASSQQLNWLCLGELA
jgi:hypothetical protein